MSIYIAGPMTGLPQFNIPAFDAMARQLRSVGYKGVPLDGLPFDTKSGIIPNQDGRVTDTPGFYAVGWIKRGPSGVIGTNKPDSILTVESLLADFRAGILDRETGSRAALEGVLGERGTQFVTFSDWQRLDVLEQAAGARLGRPRLKFTDVATMLEALK